MKNCMRKYLSVFIVIIALSISSFSALGEEDAFSIGDLSTKIQNLENQLKEDRDKANVINELVVKIEESIEECNSIVQKYDEELFQIDGKIRENEETLQKLEYEIFKLNENLNNEEEKLMKNKDRYREQVRFLYVNGNAQHLENLSLISDVGGFIQYMDFVKKLNIDNGEVFDSINESVDIIKHDRSLLEKNKATVEKLRETNVSKREEFQEKREQQIQVINDIKVRKSKYINLLQDYGIKINKTKEHINSAREHLEDLISQKEELFKGKDDVETMLETAYKFIGDPYRWGGTRPYDGSAGSGFDCSGYVQYCFRSVGINIGRSTYDQMASGEGYKVARSDLKPGDLVFFGSKFAPHHVGIYVGNNSYLHSPQTGDYIKISPMTRSDFVTGKRFID